MSMVKGSKYNDHSKSFKDLEVVVAEELAGVPPCDTPAKRPRITLKAHALKAASTQIKPLATAKAQQESENDFAEVVVVFEPEGTSLMMGGLHPRASLFEKPVNLEAAKSAHEEFRRVMREQGVKVLTVRDILAYGVEDRIGERVDLEDLAMHALTYELAPGFSLEDLAPEDQYYLSDSYKRTVLEHMSITQLVDTILIHSVVQLQPSYRDTGMTASYKLKPLSNLVYTRDQQITTAKGIVMCRLRSTVRQLEVALMKFCFEKLGLDIMGEVVEPGYLEGGDFFPISLDLAMVGVGLRSNVEAVKQLMTQDLFGTRRVAIVRDDFEQHQDRMHLDCVFSVLGEDVCLMLEEMMGEASATRRLVDEYVRDANTGAYSLLRHNVEFSAYMQGEGFHIIPIKGDDQLKYACNVLNLGNSRIIGVHAETARQIVRDPHFKGDVQVIDYSPITSMYGAVHCSSQVIKRTPCREYQQLLHTSDGQTYHWPPKALTSHYQQPENSVKDLTENGG